MLMYHTNTVNLPIGAHLRLLPGVYHHHPELETTTDCVLINMNQILDDVILNSSSVKSMIMTQSVKHPQDL